MNQKQKLRKYLREQDLQWQILFVMFYLDHFGLVQNEFEFDIRDAVKFSNDEQDFELIYSIIDFLNFNEEKIFQTLQQLHFKPIAWQYDFIETVSELSGFNITQTLDKDALATAYGFTLLLPNINLEALQRQLDEKYARLFESTGRKIQKFKRNFMLALECMLWEEPDTETLNFRELLAHYVPKAGLDAVINAYKHAMTPDVRLTKEEMSCLGFAYYSPFFYDEINAYRGTIPEGSVLACTETKLIEDRHFFSRNRRWLEDIEDDDEDECDSEFDDEYGDDGDDDDEQDDDYSEAFDIADCDIDDSILFNSSGKIDHLAVYVDPLQRCVINSIVADNTYANVYIEKSPLEKFNNTLPDFIRYHKNCLYTVEFVNDARELKVARELNQCIDNCETKMKRINDELLRENLCHDERSKLENKLQLLGDQLNSCYFVS